MDMENHHPVDAVLESLIYVSYQWVGMDSNKALNSTSFIRGLSWSLTLALNWNTTRCFCSTAHSLDINQESCLPWVTIPLWPLASFSTNTPDHACCHWRLAHLPRTFQWVWRPPKPRCSTEWSSNEGTHTHKYAVCIPCVCVLAKVSCAVWMCVWILWLSIFTCMIVNLFDISINMLQSSKEMCMYVCMSTKLE